MAFRLDELCKRVQTASDMMEAFTDEATCRQILEAMVWPEERYCPFCGSLRSYALVDRDHGCKARPGLYQCAEKECRAQFTVTTRTPLHATKLRLSVWLKAIWLSLQTDKGMSSPRLAELVGVTQATAWRMGHVIRLMMASTRRLDGLVEADEVMVGGKPRKNPADPDARRNKQGHTTKQPVLVVVRRPEAFHPGAPSSQAAAKPLDGLSAAALQAVIETVVAPTADLVTDQHAAFKVVGVGFATHASVNHSRREYVRDDMHVNGAEGFNDRVRRTVAGVFHHISQAHSELYLGEVAFRWNQRVFRKIGVRRTRGGKVKRKPLYDRVAPILQMCRLFPTTIGRQIRRTHNGSIRLIPPKAVFGM